MSRMRRREINRRRRRLHKFKILKRQYAQQGYSDAIVRKGKRIKPWLDERSIRLILNGGGAYTF